MTSHEDLGFFRRTFTSLGRALRRWAGWPGSGPGAAGTAGSPQELEFEPVHGWTWRQLEDYLRRNPGYRHAYEAEFRRRSDGRLVPGAGPPEVPEHRPGQEAAAAPVPALRRREEAQPPGNVSQPSTPMAEVSRR
jgi:hypothetical protein